MLRSPGPIFRGIILVLVLASLAGCPFEFGDEETILGACEIQADCPKHHTCSTLSQSCILTTPPTMEKRLVGPFRCPLRDIRFGGSAMVARWADFTFETDEGPATFPGLSVGLDHYCFMAQSDEEHFLIQADGARSFNPEFNQVIFWRLQLRIPYTQLAAGVANVMPSESYVYACPGFPAETAWTSGAVDQCTGVMMVGAGTIDFNLDRFEQYQELSGYVDLDLFR